MMCSGTSMATPLVSAAAALLFAGAEAYGKTVTYLDVKRALLSTTNPVANGDLVTST